ncbi:5-formyltetrahydrofolate cyclo-ligase, mitochondrial [Linum grandiflorum]
MVSRIMPLQLFTLTLRQLQLRPFPTPFHFTYFSTKLPPATTTVASFPTKQSPVAAMNADDQSSNLDELFKQKRLLRSKVRKSLKSMDPSLRSQQDEAIQSIVLEAPWFKSSQRLCAYISCSALREVDTSKLLSHILRNHSSDGNSEVAKKLYVPRVEDKNSNMRMFHISSMDDLIANSMDILEPAAVDRHGNQREDVMQADEPVDLFILPGLAFDKSGRRLGRGGGYYDTLLSKYQLLAKEKNWKQPLLVALTYSTQIVEEGAISMTDNDVPIDALVSPSGVIPISSTALERMEI